MVVGCLPRVQKVFAWTPAPPTPAPQTPHSWQVEQEAAGKPQLRMAFKSSLGKVLPQRGRREEEGSGEDEREKMERGEGGERREVGLMGCQNIRFLRATGA